MNSGKQNRTKRWRAKITQKALWMAMRVILTVPQLPQKRTLTWLNTARMRRSSEKSCAVLARENEHQLLNVPTRAQSNSLWRCEFTTDRIQKFQVIFLLPENHEVTSPILPHSANILVLLLGCHHFNFIERNGSSNLPTYCCFSAYFNFIIISTNWFGR